MSLRPDTTHMRHRSQEHLNAIAELTTLKELVLEGPSGADAPPPAPGPPPFAGFAGFVQMATHGAELLAAGGNLLAGVAAMQTVVLMLRAQVLGGAYYPPLTVAQSLLDAFAQANAALEQVQLQTLGQQQAAVVTALQHEMQLVQDVLETLVQHGPPNGPVAAAGEQAHVDGDNDDDDTLSEGSSYSSDGGAQPLALPRLTLDLTVRWWGTRHAQGTQACFNALAIGAFAAFAPPSQTNNAHRSRCRGSLRWRCCS